MNRIEKVREVVDEILLTMPDEKELICTAIYNHSDKSVVHDSLDEILKDADVMQHTL